MLPRESVDLEKHKMNYAFYLSRLFEGADSYFKGQVEKFNTNFREYAIKQKVSNQQVGENWQEMSAIFSGGRGPKRLQQAEKFAQYSQVVQG